MKLESALKIAHGRCALPEDTVRRLEPALSRLSGYRYREEKLSDDLYWGQLLLDDLEFPAMGKGTSSVLCRAAALAEGAEWLSLRRRRSLSGYVKAHQKDVVDPLRIEDLVAHVSTATPKVIERIKLTENARHWVDGHSLTGNRTLKVPLEYIHGISGTNGLAAGNRIEEAVGQAINEVFERRACITVLRQKLVMPTIDIRTIANPVIRRQYDFMTDRNTEVYIKDFSFGGALPCVGVYFVDRSVPGDLQSHHSLKACASFDREDALMKCFTEYAQGREMNSPGSSIKHEYQRLVCHGDDTDYFLALFWLGYVPYTRAEFLKEGNVVPFDKGANYPDCLDDIRHSISICRRLGKDVIAVDLTDPAIGFPVVQVVVPGYSDILPYHPRSSSVLFTGWTRDMALGSFRVDPKRD